VVVVGERGGRWRGGRAGGGGARRRRGGMGGGYVSGGAGGAVLDTNEAVARKESDRGTARCNVVKGSKKKGATRV